MGLDNTYTETHRMASVEEKDKEREERFLNRNRMKEHEEKAKLIQEGKKKTGVCRGIPIFLIFASNHNLCFKQK